MPCTAPPWVRHLLRAALPVFLTATTSAQTTALPATNTPRQPASASAAVAANLPGQFDFYLLDMPWGAAFCSSIKDVSATCKPQPGFVVHGLWPQNNDGTWPQFCSHTTGPTNPARNLDITPDLALLQHEWDKHGTCSGLSPARFFQAERTAFTQVHRPLALIALNNSRTYTPLFALAMFYMANPEFPPGSFSLSCKNSHVTAVEACFSKSLRPIRCQGLKSCEEQVVTFDPLPTNAQ